MFTFPIWKRSQELNPYEKFESYSTKPAVQDGKLFYVRKKKPEQLSGGSKEREISDSDDSETLNGNSEGMKKTLNFLTFLSR